MPASELATMAGANLDEETGSMKQACAACKHQRKKCSPDTCMLYPYFPAEKTQDFSAVHKYYGVSNLIKHLKKLAVEERQRTVESFVWAARAWNQNPNTGPLGLYMDLAQENQRLQQEIQKLKSAAANLCKTENLGTDSSLNANYGALVRVPIEDVTSFDPMPINYHQGNGLYYDDQGGLNTNFGNVERFNQMGRADYQRASMANQMEITHNTERGREVGYAPYNVSNDGLWTL